MMLDKFCFALLTLFFALSSNASIWGSDDRVDMFEVQDPKILELSKSVAALIPKERMERLANGDYLLKGDSLEKAWGFCPESKFASQPFIANCSASLIDEDKILTAGHCLNMPKGKDSYYVVFGYELNRSSQEEIKLPKEDVFVFAETIYYNFDLSMSETAIDLAVLRLDRPAKRKPLKMDIDFRPNNGDEVFVLGFPLGLPLKLAPNGYVWNEGSMPNSFRHDLDTFSVNSGSPVFDRASSKLIGVHVRGTGNNFKYYGRQCREWFRASRARGDYGEANLLTPLLSSEIGR